jgi:hypothetical protein
MGVIPFKKRMGSISCYRGIIGIINDILESAKGEDAGWEGLPEIT